MIALFVPGLILGTTILGFVIWLEWRERQTDDAARGFEREYLARRRRGRVAIHWILVVTGFLVLLTGIVPRGMLWIALWSAVCGLLVMVVAVAMVDLWRSNRYLYHKLPEIRRETLGKTKAQDSEAATGSAAATDPAKSPSRKRTDP